MSTVTLTAVNPAVTTGVNERRVPERQRYPDPHLGE